MTNDTHPVDTAAAQQWPSPLAVQVLADCLAPMLDLGSAGALLLDPDALVRYANARAASLLGEEASHLPGQAFVRFIPEESQLQWAVLLAGGWAKYSTGEINLRDANDGSTHLVRLQLQRIDCADQPLLGVLIEDLTSRHEMLVARARLAAQAELLARQAELLRDCHDARPPGISQDAATLERILDGIPLVAWVASAEGHNEFLNQAWFEFIGQPPSELASTHIGEYIHPTDLPIALMRWQENVPTGAPFEVECRIRNAAGEYRWMLGRARALHDDDGQVQRWIGTYTDVHDLKLAQERLWQMKQQLRTQNTRLQHINRDLDTFVYTASHDLKAPITNIEGLLQVLEESMPADLSRSEEVQPILGMLHDSVRRFQHTIDQLTAISHLPSARPAAPVDVSEVVRAVLLDLAPLLTEARAELHVHVASSTYAWVEERHARSIVLNLLSNAIKYRSPQRIPVITVRCQPRGTELELSVQDNGTGIPATARPRLFNLFQRFHAHIEGSGVGLFMLKRIVDNAGGQVSVESVEGEGTTFTVLLPAQ